jgi:hypothetical protein
LKRDVLNLDTSKQGEKLEYMVNNGPVFNKKAESALLEPDETRFFGGKNGGDSQGDDGDIHNIATCDEYAIIGYWRECSDRDDLECYKMFQVRDPLKINYVRTHEMKRLFQVFFLDEDE